MTKAFLMIAMFVFKNKMIKNLEEELENSKTGKLIRTLALAGVLTLGYTTLGGCSYPPPYSRSYNDTTRYSLPQDFLPFYHIKYSHSSFTHRTPPHIVISPRHPKFQRRNIHKHRNFRFKPFQRFRKPQGREHRKFRFKPFQRFRRNRHRY